MPLTMDDVREHLGPEFKSDHGYVLSTHKGARLKEKAGWKRMGELPDSTLGETGTMVILESPQPVFKKPATPIPESKPSLLGRLLGHTTEGETP